MRILLVEDDATIIDTLSELLASEGYAVTASARQDDAIELIGSSTFDLILLDVTLEQGSGFAVCAAARKESPCLPVIFLTASDDEYSTVAGFDMGAVDYIAKPFRARELLARIASALRRIQGAPDEFSFGDLLIDPASATVRKRGSDLILSALEYRLLLLFAQHPGKLISRERIRTALWDSAGEYMSDNAINVYIKRLREKIEEDPSEPVLVVTVRGLGYKAGV